ncbi:MAG: terminase [Phycisphaerae bacterium]|nr:terminase [Phycisphaerae bacterium]
MTKADKEKLKQNLNNRLWRLNNLYYIMDEQGNKVKFKLNAVQYALYMAMWWLNIVLKSRQHGITTFICIFFLDAILFNENVKAGIIAHKLEDAKKIFADKIKFAYDHLPASLRKLLPAIKDDACVLTLRNNSSIYVSTSMRSGTLQFLHISEYGYVCAHEPQKAKEIKTGALETVHTGGFVFIESTAEGIGNDFHAMCKNAEDITRSKRPLSDLDFKFHFFGWFEKPENITGAENIVITPELMRYFANLEQVIGHKLTAEQKAWYAAKKRILGQDIFKEHPSTPDEAFRASLEGAYFGTEMALIKEKGQIDFVPYDPAAKVFTFWDTGNIYTSIWFAQFKGERINLIDHYFDDLGQGLPHFAMILQGKGYVYGGHFAGPDIDPVHGGNRKSFHTGKTTIEIAKGLGIDFQVISAHSFNDRIKAMQRVIYKCFFDKEKTESGYTGLFNFRRRKNIQLSTDDRPVFFDEPVRDTIDIHIADSFGHLAVHYEVMCIKNEFIGSHEQILPPGESRAYDYRKTLLTNGLRRIA